MRRPLHRADGDQGDKLMFLDDRNAQPGKDRALPWSTPPSNLGSAECRWCWRFIYAPAVPCSVEVVAGLADITTPSGPGARCKWELATRVEAGAIPAGVAR